jgi:uncharacterized MnhB-related membrane protein
MIALQLAVLALVLAAGTAVVLTRHPPSQAIGVSFFGMMLAMMFFIFQAPDVALSQIVIGAVGLPLMILLALARIRRDELSGPKDDEK